MTAEGDLSTQDKYPSHYDVGPWMAIYLCKECGKELPYTTVAVCPHCAARSHSMMGDLYHTRGAKRFVRTVPWWKFWGERGFWEKR